MDLVTSLPAILSIAGGAFGWFWTQTRSLDKRITRIEHSLAVLDERLRHIPDARDFAALNAQLTKTEASCSSLSMIVEQLTKRLDRFEDWAQSGSAQ